MMEQVREIKQKNFVKRWEDKIFEYLANNGNPISTINLFPKSSYKYFLQNISSYLLTLNGNDRINLSKLINETKIYDYLLSHLRSRRKKKLIFAAYYLGLARSTQAKFILRKKLKTKNEMVFLSCALSLARMNELESLDDILNEALKFKKLSRDILLSVLLEFDESVCEKLLKRLDLEKSLWLKAIIISALKHFKYKPAATLILPILVKEKSVELVIESIKYFGAIEYLDASTAIRFFLLHSHPEIRTEAIRAAAKIGSAGLENRIWSLIFDKDQNVKVTAAEAMYDFSNSSKDKLKQLAYSNPNTTESSVARMIISERAIHLN
jgi:DNA-binding protein Fis